MGRSYQHHYRRRNSDAGSSEELTPKARHRQQSSPPPNKAHETYSVSSSLPVVEACPASTLMVRPMPSYHVLDYFPLVSAFFIGGEFW